MLRKRPARSTSACCVFSTPSGTSEDVRGSRPPDSKAPDLHCACAEDARTFVLGHVRCCDPVILVDRMTCDTILGCIAHLNHTLIGSLLSLLIALLAFLALVVQVRLVSVYVVIVEVPAKCSGQAGGQRLTLTWSTARVLCAKSRTHRRRLQSRPRRHSCLHRSHCAPVPTGVYGQYTSHAAQLCARKRSRGKFRHDGAPKANKPASRHLGYSVALVLFRLISLLAWRASS